MDLRDYFPWLPKEVIKTLNAQFDTKDSALPNLLWVSASQVNVVGGVGNSDVMRLTFKDGVQRVATAPLPFSPAITGPGGLDTGSEAPSTWYYLYLVPSASVPTAFEVRGSVNDPSVGPTGFTTSLYVGPTYNNSSGNLLSFEQTDSRFDYDASRLVLSLGAGSIVTDPVPVEVLLTDFIPATANTCCIVVTLKSQAGGAGFAELYVSGHQSGSSLYQIQAVETEANQEISEFPTPSTPKRIYRRIEESVGNLDEFKIVITGWIDSYLAER